MSCAGLSLSVISIGAALALVVLIICRLQDTISNNHQESLGKKGFYIPGLGQHMEHLGLHSEVISRMKAWASGSAFIRLEDGSPGFCGLTVGEFKT